MTDQREKLRPVLRDILDRPMPSTVEFEQMLDAILTAIAEEGVGEGEEAGDIYKLIEGFADNIEELAFRIPAPNEQTPQFVTYANAMRFIAQKRRERSALTGRGGWRPMSDFMEPHRLKDPDELERLPWMDAIAVVPGGKPSRLPVRYNGHPLYSWIVLDSRKTCEVLFVRDPLPAPPHTEGGDG